MPPRSDALQVGLEGVSSILLLASARDDHDDEACVDLLDLPTADRVNVLGTTFAGGPSERLDVWRRFNDGEPAKTAIVCVGEMTRSAAVGGSEGAPGPGGVVIDTVSAPADLTGLGIRLTDRLDTWSDDGHRTAVCFHSVTDLLQHVPLRRAFRFLHVLVNRLDASDAVAHFHMDPDAHDRQEISTITTLIDAVVEVDPSGERTIRTR